VEARAASKGPMQKSITMSMVIPITTFSTKLHHIALGTFTEAFSTSSAGLESEVCTAGGYEVTYRYALRCRSLENKLVLELMTGHTKVLRTEIAVKHRYLSNKTRRARITPTPIIHDLREYLLRSILWSHHQKRHNCNN